MIRGCTNHHIVFLCIQRKMALFGYIVPGQCMAFPNKRIKYSSNTLCMSCAQKYTISQQKFGIPRDVHSNAAATTWNKLETDSPLLSVNVNNRYTRPTLLIPGEVIQHLTLSKILPSVRRTKSSPKKRTNHFCMPYVSAPGDPRLTTRRGW
jgi:hypothetical protein